MTRTGPCSNCSHRGHSGRIVQHRDVFARPPFMITAVVTMAPMLEAVVSGVADLVSEFPERPVQPAHRSVTAARFRKVGMSEFTAKIIHSISEFLELLPLIA